MRIQITLELYDEFTDPNHEMGITNDGFEKLMEALSGFGDDVEIEKVEA